jgi:TolB-like protein/tRNA A-37 threonylcarbamoyl transferase component Bud32
MKDGAEGTAATVLAEGPGGSESTSIEAVIRPVIGGRYEIQGFIGAGAMGTVYRAKDRELDEVIAVKVLKKELVGTRGILDRFRREVKLARRVTHRNVARMFDIGDDGGDRFLTMELVEGESLAHRLARLGRLPYRDVAAIAKDVCAGLAVAHEAGVLHRDLKPDNVIVAKDGRAVITDFGIARAVAEGDAKTAIGSFVGTPLYMAPEQVEGIVELDARADLYALGTMMYELLTGEPAWQRPSMVAVAAARLLSPPPDPRAKVADLPDDLRALVLRLMARERDDRPSSAAEVAQALGAYEAALAPPTTNAPPADTDRNTKRVAVLPLVANEEDAWLAFGLVDELTTDLQRANGIAIREALLERGVTGDGREIGRRLGVDAVVTGILRRKDEAFRATLRIVTVEDGYQLWAQTFACPAGDVGRVADRAAAAIASVLTTRAVFARRDTVNPEVEERYLRGKYLLHHGIGAFRDRSVEILREATEMAPDDARVAGGYAIALARAYRAETGEVSGADDAKRAALRALDLDATRPEGRVALGTVQLADGEVEKAAIEIAGALRVAPSNVYALDTMGRMLAEAGAAEEGLRLLDLALSKEDIVIARHARVRTRILLGEWDQVHEWMSELPRDSSGAYASAMAWMRFLLWSKEDGERAKSIMQAVLKLDLDRDVLATLATTADDPQSPSSRETIARIVRAALARMPRRAMRARALVAQVGAEIAMNQGDEEAALAALRAADEANVFDLLLVDRCPLFDPLRERPEFQTVRSSIAARAQAIIAAYERSRVSSRVRA